MPVQIRKGRFNGDRVYERRIELGLGLEEAGILVHVDTSTISAWELKRWRPSPRNLKKLCQAFQKPPEYFFD